jgi:hypothetical protein
MSFTQNKLHAKRWKTKTKQQFDIQNIYQYITIVIVSDIMLDQI